MVIAVVLGSPVTNLMADFWSVFAKRELNGVVEIFAGWHIREELGVEVVQLSNNSLQVCSGILRRIEIDYIVEAVIRWRPRVHGLKSVDEAFHNANNLVHIRRSLDSLMVVATGENTALSDFTDLGERFWSMDEVESDESNFRTGDSDVIKDLLAFVSLGVVAIGEDNWLVL